MRTARVHSMAHSRDDAREQESNVWGGVGWHQDTNILYMRKSYSTPQAYGGMPFMAKGASKQAGKAVRET